MNLRNFAALALVLTVVACAPAGSTPSPEIAAASERWEQALNSGDIEAIVALYTDGARLFPPNMEILQGHDGVRASFEEMVAAGLTGQFESTEARVAGDIGYRLGTYALTAPDGTLVDRGKYIETWRDDGGEWKISNDIWNSDLPPPPPAGSTLLFTHDVQDADHWLAAWTGENSREDIFKQHGVSSARVFQCADKPNTTALMVQVEDMAAFQTVMESDEIAQAKAEDGVKDKTLRMFGEVK